MRLSTDRKGKMKIGIKKPTRKELLRAILLTVITVLIILGIGLLIQHFGFRTS